MAETSGPSTTLRTETVRAPTYAEVVTRGGHEPTNTVTITTQAAHTIVLPPQATHARITDTSITPPRVIQTPLRATTTDSPIRPKMIMNTMNIQTPQGLLVRGDWPIDEEVPRAGLQKNAPTHTGC